jgi:hypothetical protein
VVALAHKAREVRVDGAAPRTGEVSVGGRDHLVLAATEAKRESGLTIVTDRMFSPSAATRLKSSALLREWPTAW